MAKAVVSMKAEMEFSILSYFPSVATGENINVGIVLHNKNNNMRLFHSMKNWRRLESFDDELDIEYMKNYLKGIKAEVENNLFNDEYFSLENYTRGFVNELRFGEVCSAKTDDVNEFIDQTCKIYMRRDYEKRERLTRGAEKKYLKSYMTGADIVYSTDSICGEDKEPITYDFRVGNYGFKLFSFEDKDPRRMLSSAKVWAYNAQSAGETMCTVIVYDEEMNDDENYLIIKRILSRHAEFVSTENAIKIIEKAGRECNQKTQLSVA